MGTSISSGVVPMKILITLNAVCYKFYLVHSQLIFLLYCMFSLYTVDLNVVLKGRQESYTVFCSKNDQT